MNPRNYFFPIAPSVQLTEDLSGALVYVDNQLGAKSTNDPITGIFLFRTNHHDPIDPSDDAYMVEEYTLYEAWWQADLPFDAPFETKLQIYNQTGALWLDNDLLSCYVLLHSQHPHTWRKRNEYGIVESFCANHANADTYRIVQHYLDAQRLVRPEYSLIHDYLESVAPNLYADILSEITIRLGEMYQDKLNTTGLPTTEPYLVFLVNLVHSNIPTWWQCYDQSYYPSSPYHKANLNTDNFSIEAVLLGMLAACYWREHPDFSVSTRIPFEAASQPLPITTREFLWEAYLCAQRPRIYKLLINEDSCDVNPTREDIKHALLLEELTKHLDFSPYPYEFCRRITLFRNQFLTFLGATEADLSPELPIDPHVACLPGVHEPTLEDYQSYVRMLTPGGFFALPKVTALSKESQARLVEKLQVAEAPFCFAMMHVLEWNAYLKNMIPGYSKTDARARYFSYIFRVGERPAKGYINVLNPNSKEDQDRYTTNAFLPDAEAFYQSLLP